MKRALTLALLATVATASVASADSYFTHLDRHSGNGIVELGTVVSDAAGTVEIYDFNGGEAGALLGTSPVRTGANGNVRVNINSNPTSDLLAVLKSGDTVLAEKEVRVD